MAARLHEVRPFFRALSACFVRGFPEGTSPPLPPAALLLTFGVVYDIPIAGAYVHDTT